MPRPDPDRQPDWSMPPAGGESDYAALDYMLRVRRFELDFYRRCTVAYWGLMGLLVAGFMALQSLSFDRRVDWSITLACMGFVFGFAWLMISKRSASGHGGRKKKSRRQSRELMQRDEYTATQPTEANRPSFTSRLVYIMARVNQVLAAFVMWFWAIWLGDALSQINFEILYSWFYALEIFIAIMACVAIFLFSRLRHS